jgi:hypothetical protein
MQRRGAAAWHADDAEGDAEFLGQARQIAIHLEGTAGAAGHCGDHERRSQALAEPTGAAVDLLERQVGDSVVQEFHLLE